MLLGGATASIVAGLLLMRLIGPHNSWPVLLPGSALAGVGWRIVNPVTTDGALAAVEPARAALASGIVSFSRAVGFAAGVAAIGAASGTWSSSAWMPAPPPPRPSPAAPPPP